MAKKRGTKKKAGVSRYPCGKIRSDGGTEHSAMQREAMLDRASAALTLSLITIPESARTRQEQDIVLAIVARVRDPLFGSLVGLAFKRSLFVDADGDGRELLQAADIYAALHRQVWGKLPADIEADLTKRYGLGAWNLLLEVGRVRGPAPPASHFRKLVGETPAPSGDKDTDPAEHLKRRLRHADRFGAARLVLYGSKGERQRRGAVVENIVIWNIEPAFLRAGEVRNARVVDEQAAFVFGLRALAEHFDLFDKREQGDRRGERP